MNIKKKRTLESNLINLVKSNMGIPCNSSNFTTKYIPESNLLIFGQDPHQYILHPDTHTTETKVS